MTALGRRVFSVQMDSKLVFVLSGDLVKALVWAAIILPAVYVYYIFHLCAT